MTIKRLIRDLACEHYTLLLCVGGFGTDHRDLLWNSDTGRARRITAGFKAGADAGVIPPLAPRTHRWAVWA